MASRILKLRRPDVCVVCGTSIEASSEAWWDAVTKTATCLACHRVVTQTPNSTEPELLDRRDAGASARREYERRKTSREASVRGAHRHIGGLLLWLKDAPQHEIAFKAPCGAQSSRSQLPARLAQALLHIILSHHGCLEHGSPVLPSTREALVVHAMDKLSGDLGSFDRLERETAEDETWSRFDRALGRAVLLADRDTCVQTIEPK